MTSATILTQFWCPWWYGYNSLFTYFFLPISFSLWTSFSRLPLSECTDLFPFQLVDREDKKRERDEKKNRERLHSVFNGEGKKRKYIQRETFALQNCIRQSFFFLFIFLALFLLFLSGNSKEEGRKENNKIKIRWKVELKVREKKRPERDKLERRAEGVIFEKLRNEEKKNNIFIAMIRSIFHKREKIKDLRCKKILRATILNYASFSSLSKKVFSDMGQTVTRLFFLANV